MAIFKKVFLDLGDININIDHIVTMRDDKKYTVFTLTDGQTVRFKLDKGLKSKIFGRIKVK